MKSPKLYVADTGLLCSLLAIEHEQDLLSSPLVGAIWETFVFAELRKAQAAVGGAWFAHFWQDRAREVDLLLHRGGRFELYEIKWTMHAGIGDAAGLHAVAERLGADRVIRRAVICRTPNVYPIDAQTQAWPVEELDRRMRESAQ